MICISINGNINSIKESIRNELEKLTEFQTEGEFLPEQLADRLAELTGIIGREIALYLNRKGKVVSVSIGNNSTVSLPEVEGKRDRRRMSGIRCIHTHPGGDGRLSSVDFNSLLELRLDAMVAVGVEGQKVTEMYAALPFYDAASSSVKPEIYGPVKDSRGLDFLNEIIISRASGLFFPEEQAEGARERAILVGLETFSENNRGLKSTGERLLDELEELALTAGVEVVEKVLQKKKEKDPASFIGRGKLDEISLMLQSVNAGVLIFDDELTGAQIRNIEELTGAKVLDRTMLILDIFAQRARSMEGKLQVELAQLNYRLPRLIGLGGQLSRLGGGIGTRGPGEKKLEIDRRHIRRRITFLENELKEIGKRRNLIRTARKRSMIPVIALVGYTNAGKSTLMNTICGTDVFAEDKLFATLDPTTRKFRLPDGREALLVDTVGFIRKLPHDLIEAFKSTLEEAAYADALIHVADASDEELDVHIEVVENLLKELGALDKPNILALNKSDLLTEKSRIPIGLRAGKLLEVSALNGSGINELLCELGSLIPRDEEKVSLTVPYNFGWVMPYIRENGRVVSEDFTAEGVVISAVVNKAAADRLMNFRNSY